MHQVVCVKWGSMYGPEFVNRLYAGVARNLAAPFRLVCFTDDTSGIRPEVDTFPLPDLGCPVPTSGPGKWSKLRLWGAELGDLSGPALFLDLDVVITGPLQPFFDIGSPDDVILARNWVRPLERLGQTSIFRFPVGGNPDLLERFRADPEGIAARYRYEQRYVTNEVRGGVTFWPRGLVAHFRINCLPTWPLRMWQTPRLPKRAAVVIFPGLPNPGDAILGQWRPEVPHVPALEHIRQTRERARRGDGRFWRELRHYYQPAHWVAEHWRD